MNAAPQSGQSGPAPIRAFALVGETLSAVYRYRRALVKIATVPAAVWALFGFVQLYLLKEALQGEGLDLAMYTGSGSWTDVALSVFGMLISAIIFTGLAIACHRLILLQTMPKSRIGFDFGWREVRYIGYALAVGIVASIPFIAVTIGAMLIMSSVNYLPAGNAAGLLTIAIIPILVAAFIFSYVSFFRLSLVVPAIALDAQSGIVSRLKRAWRLSRPGYGRLTGAWIMTSLIITLVLVVPQFLALFIYSVYGGLAMLAIIDALARVISTVLFAFMLSLAYRRLGGEIPEKPAPTT